MIKKLALANRDEAQALLQIQLPAYKIEAERIGFDGIPALRDTVETLQACNEEGFGWWENGMLAGAITYEYEEEQLVICRLVVDPEQFRKGIGEALLKHLLAENQHVARIAVHTGAANVPAINLYKKHRFVESEEREIAPGIKLVRLQREHQT
ncbi:GNAT family N-acetyltransferase [Brevibacillus migulae]|uniref:GNAT family N-acetyltransferase n=1 Tax=Brevibacillus migulae TaxID=1644114 RepID=UPI00106E2CF9|nr:GNAT family N-acetyltransferase [Brevibacillus migulae]